MHRRVVTGDESITCFNDETGELYHNQAGAFTEALKNYVEPAGLAAIAKTGSVTVMDVCFGLGYNTFVLLDELRKLGITCDVNILGLDIDEAILSVLDDVLADKRFAELRKFMNSEVFKSEFGVYEFQLDEAGKIRVHLKVKQQDIREAAMTLEQDFDLVFHDGFSPYKVPELWTVDLFRRYHKLLGARRGALLTYSAAPAVRAGLRLAGFNVFATTAVGSKHGGTLATISAEDERRQKAAPLTDEQEERLKTRSGIPYRDNETLTATREQVMSLREREQQH
ncbi:MAG: hypothetical protein K2Y22_15565 [Candidatus Obscuribacterales bacterium]|nr:hypothetical protein [Candidatus Obscuribacterales bacterium]